MNEQWGQWMQLIASVAMALAAIIPLVNKLVEQVKKAVREKNWSLIVGELSKYMALAESMFKTGAERKEWVLTMIKAFADSIDYAIDMTVIGNTIDNLCAMSKQVNVDEAGAVS